MKRMLSLEIKYSAKEFIYMNIQSFSQPRIKLLDPLCFDKMHEGCKGLFINFIAAYIQKKIARYIRDHNPNQFAYSNSIAIRRTHHIYNYLFPTGSHRKYFMEVAVPDNFLTAFYLVIISLPYPAKRIHEIGIIVLRTCFVAYFADRVRLIAYQIIPHDIGTEIAPTGIYRRMLPNGRIMEARN